MFEPNDEPLWAQIRLNVGAFMHNLFRQGAFQGKTPRDAYFVKCDKETTTQNDINLGIVNIVVGFAPLKPAEFVVIKIQQMAGQIADLREGDSHGSIQRQRTTFRSVQELQIPRQVGRQATSPGSARSAGSKRTTEVVKHREGGDPSSSRKSPGRTEYEAITLERGVTHDKDFEKWANKVWNFGSGLGAEVSLKDFRKDIIIEALQRGRTAGDRLQGLSLLGVRIPGAARPRCQRQCGRDPAHQAGKRRLGARLRSAGTERANLHRAGWLI